MQLYHLPAFIKSAGAFSPGDVSGLRLWYDGVLSGLTLHPSSSDVSQWDDLSGNGLHATNATQANSPTTGARTINGLNALDFTGVDALSVGTGHGIADAFHAFFIIVPDVGTSNRYYFRCGLAGSASDAGFVVYQLSTNNWRVGINNADAAAAEFLTRSGLSVGSVTVLEAWVDAVAEWGLNTNDGTPTTGAPAVVTSWSASGKSLILGGFATNGTSCIDAGMLTALLYDHKLSSTDRDAVTDYLMTRAGL